MLKIIIFAYFICVNPFFAAAENISGFWKGTFNMSNSCFVVNNIEVQITQKGDSIYGNSYHYYDVDNYVKKKFRGHYDAASGRYFLLETTVSTFKIPIQCRVCIKEYRLSYSINNNNEFLKGDWYTMLVGDYAECGTGAITLSRTKESAFKEIPEISVDTGEIRLDFYDNGEIDDDSITVRVNNKTVLTHQKLSGEAITTSIRIDLSNVFYEVEMIAENLGRIPPNTALLIITAGKKRYELFLTSSNRKSAKVRFLYDKGG